MRAEVKSAHEEACLGELDSRERSSWRRQWEDSGRCVGGAYKVGLGSVDVGMKLGR